MMSDTFRFKRFEVAHGDAAMKVGTDGVLLGAWCPMEHRPAGALDIGTGTGLIALMIAQRGEEWRCAVDGVEIDGEAYRQACANFASSPWSDALRAYYSDIQGFTPTNKYDLIVSNPPWFRDSLHSPDDRRTVARHAVTLSYGELARAAAAHLAPGGLFAAIVPWEHAAALVDAAAVCGLHLSRRTDVSPLPGRPPHRALTAFTWQITPPVTSRMAIETGVRHHYCDEYVALTRDFYLTRE